MNVFKSLGKLIWGDESNPDLVQISSGQFYIYTSSRQSSKKCIYIDSMATIRRTSHPHQYHLTVTRVFEEGEEALQDDDQDLDDERAFLIDQSMRFKKGVSAGATTFSWQGLSADDAELQYEFVCDDETTVFTANNFEITVYQCMYERKYQKSHFSAEEEAFEEFQILSPTIPSRAKSTSPGATRTTGSKNDLSVKQEPVVKKEPAVKKEGVKKEGVKRGKTAAFKPKEEEQEDDGREIDRPELRNAPAKYEGVVEARGDLCLFDPMTNLFMDQADNVKCQLVRTGPYKYWLVIVANDETQQLAQPLEPRMNPVFSAINSSFIWNYFDDKQQVFSWLVRFADEAALSRFQSVFGQCMYETLHETSWAKVENVDRGYLINSLRDDVDMNNSDSEESDRDYSDEGEEDVEDEEEDASEQESDYDEDEDEDEHVGFNDDRVGDNSINSQLAVGYKDRSFVVRGNKIGVFRHNEKDGLDFATTIKNISNSKGKQLNPSKIVLHEQDKSMVMMDPTDLNTAYKMDLEYGKVVEEWKMPGTSGILNLVGDSKYAHTTGNQTMIGHSHNAMFRVDPRLSGSKIVESAFKVYAKGNDFTCAATTGDGGLAIAGSKGEIKLLNTVGKNAKTALPGMGDPIIGIDVTADGHFIIATCKTYLLLIDALNPANKKLGFNASFPANDKPKAIKLTLKPEHVATMKNEVSFTPARFNTGENEIEKTIVTSTGPYVITWNFRRVKSGHHDYQIKQYADNIVADNFKFGQDRSIIVALPHDVTALPTRHLTSPGQAFKIKRESRR